MQVYNSFFFSFTEVAHCRKAPDFKKQVKRCASGKGLRGTGISHFAGRIK
jgi:hypothetical protein